MPTRSNPLETSWSLTMFLVTMIVVTYVVGAAAVSWRYLWIEFDPDATSPSLRDAGLPADARSIEVPTADGERLEAWYAPVAGAPLVIYLHGDGDNLAAAAPRARAFVAQGFSVLALDYRGFGASTGKPSEAGLYRDADAAWLKAINLGYEPRNIAVFGESYGAGVAIHLASQRQVAAIVLEGAYRRAADALADRFWLFPVRLIMNEHVRSDLVIPGVRTPLLMVHGEDDELTPIEYARQLFALANEPKTFVAIADSGHIALQDPAVAHMVGDWLWKQVERHGANAPATAASFTRD